MRRLGDAGTRTAEELVAALDLATPDPRDSPAGPRPRVVAVMIASADGRVTVDGRSVALGHPEDRALLRGVRAAVDAVLVGSGTLVAERYAALLDDDQRAARVAADRPPHPVIATVSRAGRLAADDVPLFGETGVPVTVYSEAGAPLDGAAADVRTVGLGEVTPAAVLHDLHAHHGAASVSCEGGPGLLRELVATGCVDDLLLTVAPLLVAGDGPTSLTGAELDPPVPMTLEQVHRADQHVFLHYTAA